MATTATLGEHMRSRRKHIMAQGERESAAGKQKWRRACISLPSFLQTIVLFSAVSCAQSGEVPGTDACTCSPPEFTFTLDFEGNCGSNTVVPSSSISRVQCSVTDELFQPVNDEVPIVIDEINVLEFGINLALLSDTAYLGPYTDGDDFDFTSITGTPQYEGLRLPQIFQITLTGRNAQDELVRNNVGVVYTNSCGEEPIFTTGDTLGWLVFSEVSDPRDEFCEAQPTAAPGPTPAPEPSEECSCSPMEFTFRFDFDGDCPGNIEDDDAIERVACVIDNDFGDQVMDNTPTTVTKVTIEEVTASGGISKLELTNEEFANGDTFTYESTSAEGFQTPVSLQLVLEGVNQVNVGVFNVILFEYTNECGEAVEFDSDAAVGWLVVDDYEPATEAMCNEPTPAPTVAPTPAPVDPTPAPVDPTPAPVDPTPGPTPAPTAPPPTNPVVVPTQMLMTPSPTVAPVDPTPAPIDPTPAPTDQPTEEPTEEPTEAPTEAPMDPTFAPVEPTEEPTVTPTEEPTRTPTASPTPAPAVIPTQMTMVPVPTRPPTTRSPSNQAQPTQMGMMTPEPPPDANMSFDINRLLELMHEESDLEINGALRNNVRRRKVG